MVHTQPYVSPGFPPRGRPLRSPGACVYLWLLPLVSRSRPTRGTWLPLLTMRSVFHIGLFILACCQAATWNKNVVRVVVDPEDDESVALAGQLYECYLNGGPLQEHASLGGYQTEWVKNYPAEPVEKESVSKKT